MGLKLQDLEIQLGRFHLGPISFEFTKGLNLISGPNGSGKSSLLKTVAGSLKPTKGGVLGIRKPLMFLTESYLMFGHWTVERNLQHLSKLLNLSIAAEQIAPIKDFLKYRVSELSLGTRKQIEISAALALSTDILLLDESLSALDKEQHALYLSRLKNAGDLGKIILITGHKDEALKNSASQVLELKA